MSKSRPAADLNDEAERNDLVSQALVDARLEATPLAEFPERLPETLQQAYAVQSASIERWPDQVGGWKVARLPMPDRERFATERLVGPVFRSTIREVGNGSSATMPIHDGGFAAVEAEFVIELGVTVPPTGRDYSDEDLVNLVSAVYIGAEIASSPMARVIEFGATSIIADFGCNAGVVVGPEIRDWRSLPAGSFSVSVFVDGVEDGTTTPGPITGDPIGALRALVDISAKRGIELGEGALVSAGMLTGVHEVGLNSNVRVDFGALGTFDLAFEAMPAHRG